MPTRERPPREDEHLAAFRRHLRPFHDRIERTVDLMDPAVDLAAYDRFLRRSFGFIAACEAVLDRTGAPGPLALPERLKTPLLRQDLEARGIDPECVPMATDLPDVRTWPAALGYLYVIEGSTLGGQLLHRHLAARLSIADSQTHFLRSYGDRLGPMWKGMLQVLTEGLEASAEARGQITATAEATFVRLDAWHACPARPTGGSRYNERFLPKRGGGP